MIAIRQKTPDYCFVACVASALLDNGYDKLQDLIVQRFATELLPPRAQKIGVPPDWAANEKIFKELGLATKPSFQRIPVKDAIEFLKKNKHRPQQIFINTNSGGELHLVRLSEVRDDGITIMDPAADPADKDVGRWDWVKFEAEYYFLVILD